MTSSWRQCVPRLLAALLILSAARAWAQEPSAAAEEPAIPLEATSCLACHGDPSADRPVDPAAFAASAHGGFECLSCHGDITVLPHAAPLKRVSCRDCHQVEADVYLRSDHGQAVRHGVSEAASCRDCHGEPHAILAPSDAASPVFRANIPATCAQCHGQVKDMAKFQLNQAAPVASYEHSVHGLAHAAGRAEAAVCTDCHGSHDLYRSTNPASKLYWQRLPSTCGACHDHIAATYVQSVHGQAMQAGTRDAPVCTDCHGEHTIAAVASAESSVFPSKIPETCGQCHGAERITTKYRLPSHVVDTYMSSFHGLATQMGSVTAANCASCHGAHDILPSTDPRSSIHPSNLATTCGACHAGVSAQVAKGSMHSGTQPGLEHQAVSLVRRLYLWLIGLVLGGMAIHNLLDFLGKLRRHYRQQRQAGAPPRMTRGERAQHGVLILAFLTLAYTGFALKFPQAWWASPLVGRVDWRGFGHRAAAAIFVALSLYHLWFMLATRRGRSQLRALWPRRQDARQAGQMLRHYLGRAERPVLGRYSYVEKLEYWALVWGSIIMTLTGSLLVWSDWTLRLFPKWAFDVITTIHYYEAILACAAILMWHGYFVIFDPDEYPMKWTWVTGDASSADRRHRQEPPEDAPQ